MEEKNDIQFEWMPFSVRARMIEMENVPFMAEKKRHKIDYMWRDIERRAGFYGFQAKIPAPYPLKEFDLANKVAILGKEEGWIKDYTILTYKKWFLDHKEPGLEPNLSTSLKEIGLNADKTIKLAQTDEIDQIYLKNTKTAKNIGQAEVGEQVKFGIDPTGPTGGSLLANLIQTPSLAERAAQGREVGYAIIVVGIIGVAIAFWKLYSLYMVGIAVNKQTKSKTADLGNPLGRVLKVGQDNFKKDIDTLELRLAEAIMAERPSIERGISVVRIISVVAPLAGLLGTVTGMIVTFQQITLYGTGDPKLMAGGISQALVTTVLGLLVAIPTTLLHSFTASSSKGIISILEEQSTGILAEHSESS